MGGLKILTQRPADDWTEKEWDDCMKVAQAVLTQGKTLVLGDKRCFFCGKELGEIVGSTVLNGKESRNGLLILNHCDGCYYKISGGHNEDTTM